MLAFLREVWPTLAAHRELLTAALRLLTNLAAHSAAARHAMGQQGAPPHLKLDATPLVDLFREPRPGCQLKNSKLVSIYTAYSAECIFRGLTSFLQ